MYHISHNAFKDLKILKAAVFSNNKLSFADDKNINNSPFHYCKLLNYLDLSNNNISKIFNDWISNNNIKNLKLINNSFPDIKVNNLE